MNIARNNFVMMKRWNSLHNVLFVHLTVITSSYVVKHFSTWCKHFELVLVIVVIIHNHSRVIKILAATAMVNYAVCGTGNSKFVWAELGGSNSVKPDVSTLCCTGMF